MEVNCHSSSAQATGIPVKRTKCAIHVSKTLLRICNVHDVPLATNVATADMVISSPFLGKRGPLGPPTAID